MLCSYLSPGCECSYPVLPLEVDIFRGGRDGLRLVAFRGFSDPTGMEEWGRVLGWGTLPAWGRSTAELFSLRWYSMGDCSAAREDKSHHVLPTALPGLQRCSDRWGGSNRTDSNAANQTATGDAAHGSTRRVHGCT